MGGAGVDMRTAFLTDIWPLWGSLYCWVQDITITAIYMMFFVQPGFCYCTDCAIAFEGCPGMMAVMT
jgi:hypothetical protein